MLISLCVYGFNIKMFPFMFLKSIKYALMYLQLFIELQPLPITVLDSEDTFWSSRQIY